MEETKEDAMKVRYAMPLFLESFLINLESCKSRDEYLASLHQLEELAKTKPFMDRAYTYSLSKYPNLRNVEPKTIANTLREYWEIEEKQKLALDRDSTQNLKKELCKTYHDTNIELLANSKFYIKSRI